MELRSKQYHEEEQQNYSQKSGQKYRDNLRHVEEPSIFKNEQKSRKNKKPNNHMSLDIA